MKRKLLVAVIIIPIILLTLFLTLWPTPTPSKGWSAPKFEGYIGKFQKNNRLDAMNFIDLGKYSEPEHIVLHSDWIYASVKDGKIIRFKPNESIIEEVVSTGGRAFGFDFDKNGALIVTDPLYGEHGGLLRITNIDNKNNKIELLTDSVDGTPIRFADAVVVAKSGKIYFTDATQQVDIKESGGPMKAATIDIIANTSSGRILEHDPITKKTRIVAHSLSFANGISLSKDEQSLIVNELGKYRVWKVDIHANNTKAEPDGQFTQVIIDNLPGLPDNIVRGEDGRFWIGLVSTRNSLLDIFSDKPWIRAAMLRIMTVFPQASDSDYAHVIAIDENGNVLDDLQGNPDIYSKITGVTETQDRLYFHNICEINSIGWLSKEEL